MTMMKSLSVNGLMYSEKVAPGQTTQSTKHAALKSLRDLPRKGHLAILDRCLSARTRRSTATVVCERYPNCESPLLQHLLMRLEIVSSRFPHDSPRCFLCYRKTDGPAAAFATKSSTAWIHACLQLCGRCQPGPCRLAPLFWSARMSGKCRQRSTRSRQRTSTASRRTTAQRAEKCPTC